MCSSPIGGGSPNININDFSSMLDEVGGPAPQEAVSTPESVQRQKDTLDLSATNSPQAAEPYEAMPGQPQLSPTVSLPDTQRPQDTTNPADAQSAEFTKQLENLPPELRVKLLKDMAKPEGERDPQLVALENAMNEGADLSAWGQSVQKQQTETPPGVGVPGDAKAPKGPDGETKAPTEGGETPKTSGDASAAPADGTTAPKEGGEAPADLKGLLAKGTLTPEDAAKLKALGESGTLSGSEMVAVNTKLQAAGFPAVTPQASVGGTDPFAPAPGLTPTKIDPSTMSPDEMLMQTKINGLQVMKNQGKVLDAQTQALPDGDPNKASLMEYLKFITKVITDVQKMIGELSAMDAKRSAKAVMGTKAVMEAKMEKAMKALEKAQAMQKLAKVIEFAAKVLGPIIAVVCLVLAIVSGGTLAILLAVVMLVIALLASCTTIIDEIMKKVMDMIMGMFKSMGMSDEQAMIMTMVVIVILVIVMMVVTRGAGASSAAKGVAEQAAKTAAKEAVKQATKEATKQAVKEATKTASKEAGQTVAKEVAKEGAEQAAKAGAKEGTSALSETVGRMLAGQVGTTVLSHSDNVIAKGVKPLLKAMGFDEKTAELLAMLVQMLAMLAVGMYASGGGAGLGAVSAEAGAAGAKTLQATTQMLDKLVKTVEVITGLVTALGKLMLAKMTKDKGKMDAELTVLDGLLKNMGTDRELRDKSMKSLVELSDAYGRLFSNMIQGYQKVLQEMTN